MPSHIEDLTARSESPVGSVDLTAPWAWATALINEAYLRLVDVDRIPWQNRAHYFSRPANLMRRILLDFVRSRGY